MRRLARSITQPAGLALVVGLFATFASSAWAQTSIPTSDLLRVRDRATIGAGPGTTTFGDVLRIIGAGPVSGGAPAMRPTVLDADGDLLRDTTTLVSTGGAWTWGAAGTFGATLGVTGATTLGSTLGVTGATTLASTLAVGSNATITGSLIGGSGTLLLASPTRITHTDPSLTFVDSNSGVNEKVWRISAASNQFAFQSLTDALALPRDILRVFRTGNDPARIDIGQDVDLLQPAINYNTSLGNIDRKFLDLWAANLNVDIITAREVMATIGGRILVGPTTLLTLDLAPSDTTMCVKHNNARNGDRVLLEDFGKFEVIGIGAGPTEAACGFVYNVFRSLDPGTARPWFAGDGVFDTGVPGNGFWDIYADRSSAGLFSYSSAVMGSNPVAYWRFGTLLFADISGSGRNLSQTGVVSQVGDSAISDGTGSHARGGGGGYLTTPDHDVLDITDDLTVEFHTLWGAASAGTVIAKNSGLGEYEILIGATLAVQYNHGDQASTTMSINACPAGSIAVGSYTHVVITRDGSNIRCYINSVLVATTTQTTTSTAGTSAVGVFARQNGTSLVPTGTRIDELALYQRVLPQHEITQHWEARTFTVPSTQYGPAQCANVRFDFSYNGWRERLCIGNLQGKYDYATPIFGMAAGDPAETWIGADATNGFRVMHGTDTLLQADAAGNLALTGDLTIGTNGIFRSAGATALGTGTGLYMAGGATPVFRVGNPSANRISWDGVDVVAQAANLLIDANGIRLQAGSGVNYNSGSAYGFVASVLPGGIFGMSSGENTLAREIAIENVFTDPVGGASSQARIDMQVGSQGTAQVWWNLQHDGVSGISKVSLRANEVEPNTPTNLGSSLFPFGTAWISGLRIDGIFPFTGSINAAAVSCTLTVNDGIITSKTGC